MANHQKISGERRAWITGAGKGIGRALALRLARDGWTVAASARTASDLDRLADEAGALPGRILSYPLDVTDAAAVARTVEAIEEANGPLTLAVLNAGTHQPMRGTAFDAGIVRKLVETNLMGTVNGLDAILPRFVARRGGHVAVVASVAGYRGLPTAAAYGATKAALINMCEAMKPELEKAGVKLQLVSPGFVDTPLTRKNDFSMPFMIEVEDAARRIAKGLASDRFEIVFPLRMAISMKLLRLLPYRLFFRVTRRMSGGAPG